MELDLVGRHLNTLGVACLAEWDVLAFIYLHGTSLASAEQIARLLGYNKAIVGAALDFLTTSSLIRRSRNSQGARLYQLAAAVPGDSRQRILEELMTVMDDRAGRLLLIRHLRPSGKDSRRPGGLHLA